MSFRKKIKAFTVAEVLITLSIIGVVGALVFGSVIPNIQERVLVTKLKNVYAQLNSSFEVAVRMYGPPQYWNLEISNLTTNKETGLTDAKYPAAKKQLMMLLAGLSVEDIEKENILYNHYSLHGTDFTGNTETQPLYRTKDGVVFLEKSLISSPTCEKVVSTVNETLKYTCGEIKLDLNGAQGPNRYGKDIHVFYFTRKGIVPVVPR